MNDLTHDEFFALRGAATLHLGEVMGHQKDVIRDLALVQAGHPELVYGSWKDVKNLVWQRDVLHGQTITRLERCILALDSRILTLASETPDEVAVRAY